MVEHERKSWTTTKMTAWILIGAGMAYAIFSLVTGWRHITDKDWSWRAEKRRLRRAGLNPDRFKPDKQWEQWQTMRGVIFIAGGMIVLWMCASLLFSG